MTLSLSMNGFDADSNLVTYCYPSPSFDHPAGMPPKCIIVVHDAEDRDVPTAGMARDLIGPNYWGHGGDANNPTSPHYMTDPQDIAQSVHEVDRAWHCGAKGNLIGIGIEQSGKASDTRDVWDSPSGQAERKLTAALIVDICRRRPNIKPRRLSDAELAAVYAAAVADPSTPQVGGYVSHSQITNVLGGTTHTDPGPNYPWDLLDADIQALIAPPPPAPVPAPVPDLLGVIVSLPGAPANLTYQQLTSDVAAAVLNTVIPVRNALQKDANGNPAPDVNRRVRDILADLENYTSVALRNDAAGK